MIGGSRPSVAAKEDDTTQGRGHGPLARPARRSVGAGVGEALGYSARPAATVRGCGRLGGSGGLGCSVCFGSFPFLPFPNSFSISYFYLHLGHLCMNTCVAKHVHTLMGSTRGQLGY